MRPNFVCAYKYLLCDFITSYFYSTQSNSCSFRVYFPHFLSNLLYQLLYPSAILQLNSKFIVPKHKITPFLFRMHDWSKQSCVIYAAIVSVQAAVIF